jgi:hypothetical protein
MIATNTWPDPDTYVTLTALPVVGAVQGLVFEGPVRSGFFDPQRGNRRPDRLYIFTISMQPRTEPV